MNGSDSEQPGLGRSLLPLTLEDIEAVFCGRDTPEQHARYVAAFNDPDSELNAMLTHFRTSGANVLNQSLPYPSRQAQRKRRRRRKKRRNAGKAITSGLPVVHQEEAHAVPLRHSLPRKSLLAKVRRRHIGIALTLAVACGATIWLVMNFRPNKPIIALQDGDRRIELLASGRVLGLPSMSPELVEQVAVALKSARISPVNSLPSTLGNRSGSPPLSTSLLLRPFRTNVSEDRPTFRWKGTAAARTYVVRIYDDSGNIISESKPLEGLTWIPPEALPRGGIYSWDVLVTFDEGKTVLPRGGQPRPAFRILTTEEFARYKQAITNLKGSHLALGTFLVREGLLDEAQVEFDLLIRLNPDSLELRSLAEHVRALRE